MLAECTILNVTRQITFSSWSLMNICVWSVMALYNLFLSQMSVYHKVSVCCCPQTVVLNGKMSQFSGSQWSECVDCISMGSM